jgi:hypothetical protein
VSLFITCAADGTKRTARTRPGAVGENAHAESSARSTASAIPPAPQWLAAAIPFLYESATNFLWLTEGAKGAREVGVSGGGWGRGAGFFVAD